ncbi:MAG TPA: hypothetical protein VIL74_24680 [Pyrinomonadaceae bacterium]|jgi:hypothetical protein
MEILIIGGLVVALMVYASTRIKRSAAAAFEEETIETDEFALVKPEGFLSPVDNDDYLAFYAYSKEFGEEDNAEKLRQGLIKLKILAGRSLTEITKDIKKSLDTVSSEERPDAATFVLKGEKKEREVAQLFYHKLIARDERVFDLEMSVLADYRERYEERAEKLLTSFRVK